MVIVAVFHRFLDKAMHFVDSNWVALCVCGGVCAGYFFLAPALRQQQLAYAADETVSTKPQDAGKLPQRRLRRQKHKEERRPESRVGYEAEEQPSRNQRRRRNKRKQQGLREEVDTDSKGQHDGGSRKGAVNDAVRIAAAPTPHAAAPMPRDEELRASDGWQSVLTREEKKSRRLLRRRNPQTLIEDAKIDAAVQDCTFTAVA